MSEPIVALDWDSAFFGFPIAQVTARRLDEDMLDAAVEACRARGIRCAYLLLDGDDAHGSELAQAAGFVVRDVRTTLERCVDAADEARLAAAGVAPASPQQHAALEAVARDAFEQTRFTVDPGFPPDRCRDLYEAFLRRGLQGVPERVVLADPAARGFVVCRLDGAERTGTIELIAVAAEGRGRGLGGALVDAALGVFAAAGLRRATVVTQAANVASQRLYQRAGFRTREVGLWLHRWFD
ncbi:MAG TPA: GNAT family N-acetyltransferase [Conexibacter sp.]|jgi:ribosomal protein S18 acetylase RimI-like enzyme|nr:GNAT family N-acetyltransferase [Conexibacter sp.]